MASQTNDNKVGDNTDVENLSLLQKGKNIVLEVNMTTVWGYYGTQLGSRLFRLHVLSVPTVKTTYLAVTACVTHFTSGLSRTI